MAATTDHSDKYYILAINPGSTSTKIAVYANEEPIITHTLTHTPQELAQFDSIPAQFQWRLDLIEKALAHSGFDINSLSAVIGRGGIINPIESGVYEVNDDLKHDLINARTQHASNLGGLLARKIADEIGVKSYIADPVVVDEMIPYARISGLPECPRESIFHALNQKAVAHLYAKENSLRYEDLNLVVCHMGGGCSISAHRKGRVIDTTNALNGTGPMSPERSGTLPPGKLVKMCFSGQYTEAEMMRKIHGAGGLMAHLGTNSVTEVLDRILARDLHAMLVMRAMCYSICKEIGAMATAMKGDVDAILITGGIAHSKRVTDFIADYVDYIAPIFVYPGENELRALAENALAVLRSERKASIYKSEEYDDPSKINDLTHGSKIREMLLAAINSQTAINATTAIRQYLGKWTSRRKP